jgi:16S rRNA processing protein RimM
MSLVSNRVERVSKGAELWLDDRRLVVASSRPHSEKYLVRFEGFDHRDQVNDLRGIVSAVPLDDDDEIWVHDVIGSVVTDQHGVEHGEVVAVQDNPASDLLVLADGLLVPARFIDRIDEGIVYVDVPDGLFELG